MSDKKTNKAEKTRVECRLNVCGTNKANASAIRDMATEDPDPQDGVSIIKGVLNKEEKDDDSDGEC